MIRANDVHTLARIVSGLPVNGEVDALSDRFRPIGSRLVALPLESRREPWEAFLDGQADRTEIIRGMSDQDPEGPPPKADADSEVGDEWGPIRLGAMPPAEPFPLHVLPGAAARLVEEGAAAIGCPPDYIATAMLAVAAGTIGRSVSLRLKPGYFARSSVYVACVGPPSIGKTPAFQEAAKGVRRIGAILAAEHEQLMERWREESKEEKKGAKPTAPPKPRRIDVDDITMEAVPLRLADNPRGLIMLRDELSAFLLGMNQYKGGKGSDRAVILKIWSGDDITRDRVIDDSGIPLRCPHPCMSILGGLPPDMLGSLHDGKGSADGFVDRFLFAFPEAVPIPEWSERGISEAASDGWCEIVARLWQRPMRDQEGRLVPHTAYFSADGTAAWKLRHDAHAAEMNSPGFPPSMSGPWGKLSQYAGRFALILACLDHASDLEADPRVVPLVGAKVVEAAWSLVAYFKAHARRTHTVIGQGRGIGGSEATRAIVGWLREGGRRAFSESEIRQARRWITPEDLAEALSFLAERNVVRPQDGQVNSSQVGRPRSTSYDVNPSLLLTGNP